MEICPVGVLCVLCFYFGFLQLLRPFAPFFLAVPNLEEPKFKGFMVPAFSILYLSTCQPAVNSILPDSSLGARMVEHGLNVVCICLICVVVFSERFRDRHFCP